jgi:hypothetical protein
LILALLVASAAAGAYLRATGPSRSNCSSRMTTGIQYPINLR